MPFLVGAVGHFFSAGMAIPTAIISLGLGFSFFFGGFGSIVFLVVAAMGAAGTIVHLIGFYGLWRNYGSQLALGTFVYGLVTVGYSIAATVVFVTLALPSGFPSFFILSIVFLASAILSGVLLIVEGCAYIVNRVFLIPGASIAAGVLFIIAGGFACSVLLDFVGRLFSIPALIIGGILLTRAPIPIVYAVPGMVEPMTPQPPGPPGAP